MVKSSKPQLTGNTCPNSQVTPEQSLMFSSLTLPSEFLVTFPMICEHGGQVLGASGKSEHHPKRQQMRSVTQAGVAVKLILWDGGAYDGGRNGAEKTHVEDGQHRLLVVRLASEWIGRDHHRHDSENAKQRQHCCCCCFFLNILYLSHPGGAFFYPGFKKKQAC